MLRASLLFLLLLLTGSSALAQAALDVTVLRAGTREGASYVTIRLTNAPIGYRTEARTNDAGRVRFEGLSTGGRYVLTVPETPEYNGTRSEEMELRQGATRSVVLTVQPTGALDEVTVTGQASFADLNRTNAEVSATLTPAEVQALPVEGRDVTRMLYRLPGVTQATGFYPEAPNVSVNGANGLYVNYLLDGLDNNEQFLGGPRQNLPIGFIQDVTVLTNSFSAEYGRTGNGVFNFTTKSGGNRMAGETYYQVRPGSVLDASFSVGGKELAQRDLLGNSVKDGFMRHQVGAAVGGPIRRDRTFYFVDLEGTLDVKDNRLTSPALGINETVRGQNRNLYAATRFDQVWNPRLRSALRLTAGLVENERQGGGLEGGVQFPSAASTQTRNSVAAALLNTYARSGLVFESNYLASHFRWNYARPVADRPQTVVLDPTGSVVAVLGHPGYYFDTPQTSIQTQQKVTLLRGGQRIRFGGDVLYTDHDLIGGGNRAGSYTVKLTAAQLAMLNGKGAALGVDDIPRDAQVLNYSVETRPARFGIGQTLAAAYIEDQFTPAPRLTVTLGLRYDFDNLSKGGRGRYDLNNVAPRTSFNLGLGARTAVRGGYGVFYDKVLYAIYSDALQQNTTGAAYRSQIQALVNAGVLPASTDLGRVLFDGNLGADFQGVPYLGGPTAAQASAQRGTITSNERRILNPNGYDNPYTHQFSLGVQRQLRSRMLLYADAVHTRSYNLARLRNLNAPTAYAVDPARPVVRTAAQADATRPVALVPGGAKNIVMTEMRGHARYAALTVNLVQDRAASEIFAYRLGYTLSRLENDTEDINFRAMDANRFGNEWGPSINDRTHVLSGVLYATPAPGVTTTLAALVQSGQPINRVPNAQAFGGTRDLNGDGQSFGDAYVGNSDRQPGEARNSDRLPWSRTFDLGVQYDVPLGGQRVEIRADVFNVLNTANLSGYSNNATQSNQIQVGPTGTPIERKNFGAPRQFQFGLRVAF